MDTVSLITLGCPKNTVDSERMLGLLQGNEYQLTEAADEADVVVVNTCGFIGPAKAAFSMFYFRQILRSPTKCSCHMPPGMKKTTERQWQEAY